MHRSLPLVACVFFLSLASLACASQKPTRSANDVWTSADRIADADSSVPPTFKTARGNGWSIEIPSWWQNGKIKNTWIENSDHHGATLQIVDDRRSAEDYAKDALANFDRWTGIVDNRPAVFGTGTTDRARVSVVVIAVAKQIYMLVCLDDDATKAEPSKQCRHVLTSLKIVEPAPSTEI